MLAIEIVNGETGEVDRVEIDDPREQWIAAYNRVMEGVSDTRARIPEGEMV